MKALILRAVLALAVIFTPLVATAEADKPGLFVNLTTDDTWSAAKAIMFAHRRALENGHDTAIWLNVRAVYLADSDRASHVHGLMAEDGTRRTFSVSQGSTNVDLAGAWSSCIRLRFAPAWKRIVTIHEMEFFAFQRE